MQQKNGIAIGCVFTLLFSVQNHFLCFLLHLQLHHYLQILTPLLLFKILMLGTVDVFYETKKPSSFQVAGIQFVIIGFPLKTNI